MNEALPGADLIDKGLVDLRDGRETVEALLVAIGAPRLRTIGIDVPAHNWKYPEMQLYELLAKADSDSAHARYNSWVRQLIVFEATAEHVLHRLSSNPELQSVIDDIVRVDFIDGVCAIRSDLAFLQSL